MKKKNILKYERIKFLIKESDWSFKKIAEETNSHINTIYNINKGKTHFDHKESYPLRSRDGDKVHKLIDKLSKPTLAAIPRADIITIHLLNYISMLSFLKVAVDCVLLFKDIYYDDVVKLLGYDLTDEDLISLFRLRPQEPEKLRIILDSYYSPVLSLDIINYWQSSGFLNEEELKYIFKIFIKM